MQELVQAPEPLHVEPAFVTLHHTDPSLGDQLGVLNLHGFALRCKVVQVGFEGGLAIDRLNICFAEDFKTNKVLRGGPH